MRQRPRRIAIAAHVRRYDALFSGTGAAQFAQHMPGKRARKIVS